MIIWNSKIIFIYLKLSKIFSIPWLLVSEFKPYNSKLISIIQEGKQIEGDGFDGPEDYDWGEDLPSDERSEPF